MYFEDRESAAYTFGENIKEILTTIANKYIGDNPQAPYTFMPFSEKGIKSTKEGEYLLDFNTIYPQTKLGHQVHASSIYLSEEEKEVVFKVNCFSPIKIECNGKRVFEAEAEDEIDRDKVRKLTCKVLKGENNICIKAIKTRGGFGCLFASISPKWVPINLHSPFQERKGQSGWVFTEPMEEEKDTGFRWYPEVVWNKEKSILSAPYRIFENEKEGQILAWSEICNYTHKEREYTLIGQVFSPLKIHIGEKYNYTFRKNDKIYLTVKLEHGKTDVVIESEVQTNEAWGYTLELQQEGKKVDFKMPRGVKGKIPPWLYVGPLKKEYRFKSLKEICQMEKLFEGLKGKTYWRVDAPCMCVRPFVNTDKLFGRWTYPLGVTLYGLIETGRMLQREDIKAYVKTHMLQCANMQEYALWDKEQYGYAGINHQLLFLEALDDCGSFGSALLEVFKDENQSEITKIAKSIADYMKNQQERLTDGTFFRGQEDKGSIWADDLYMSIPFLCRYYKMTQEEVYLEEAIRQIFNFKNYLFMPQKKIMSHVYSTGHKVATEVPWGRGNGWVLFSLVELLQVLPYEYSKRKEVINFYNILCEGYLTYQGEKGLWHQVIDQKDAYEETSCTAMFIYGLAKGLRFKWLKDENEEKAIKAVKKGWWGLSNYCIDKKGNIYGVCKGSNFSFTAQYYMQQLGWNLNDTHGIGIVLLAGIEIERLWTN